MPGRYVAFVREDAIKEAKLDTKYICTLSGLDNSGLPPNAYSVFTIHTSETEDDLLLDEKYRKLAENPEYLKLYLTAGN